MLGFSGDSTATSGVLKAGSLMGEGSWDPSWTSLWLPRQYRRSEVISPPCPEVPPPQGARVPWPGFLALVPERNVFERVLSPMPSPGSLRAAGGQGLVRHWCRLQPRVTGPCVTALALQHWGLC